MNKRDFLKYTGSLMLASQMKVSFASTDNKDVNTIVLFLRGGADGLSMLVPYSDKYYYESRPALAIPKEKCIAINDSFGFNQNFKFINKLCSQNQLALIPLAGQINNSRSHFQAQDVMEYGINNITTYKNGFLARLAEKTNKKPISFTENTPPILRHDSLITTTVAPTHLYGRFSFSGTPKLEDQKLKDTFKVVQENMSIIENFKKQNVESHNKLFSMAKFMLAGKYNIMFADFDDWDTHANQNSRMNNLLSNLDSELELLKNGLGEKEWNKTTVIIMSEFGRVVKENGTGTDHGHGNLMMVTGGMVGKSKIHGEWLPLKKENLHEERDLKVMHEYRDILAEIITKSYGLSKSQLDYIFPDAKPTKFNII